MKMEMPSDVAHMTQDEVYNSMIQHSPGQQGGQATNAQQQGSSGAAGGMGMLPPPDASMMMGAGATTLPGQPAAAAQGNMYSFVSPHLQGHYMPQQPMGQPGAHQGMAPKARLQCHACAKLLEYDAGAQYVQCFSCSTMNAVQQKTQVGGRVLSMLCAMCSTTNLAPYGINYVRCGTCHTISQVSHAYRQDITSHPGIQMQNPAASRPYHQSEGGEEQQINPMDQNQNGTVQQGMNQE
eukprot:Gregarina_sp_Poly_1__6819@NODE_3691_length_926_cov_340_238650_g2349_i1_p1_GENE_NODE_3691_length_926_cov_340_238650_g2349_i1NODE_3691_length_926_cov_340_238650_g2349_i1_p1_ORF_typecomplete_len238_score18_38zfLSD1/PF06943_12/8_7e06zfLSD1/PF06943_12/1_6e02zfLSD1/PF06943_12/0_21zinc_ribbon_12/PF11331_8/0_67zinc_ribbon_12/PF11331_8/6_6zinc_ribbon_12/PF11331_8/7_5Mulike_Com/PF10122_9/0_23Mulike_Com/PF10122_9/58zinc_ribbon_6/PF14599_6/10zinc_ribbon_6/PF14599_6/0_26DUF1922/PF09082_10/1_4DUF1922/PF09082_